MSEFSFVLRFFPKQVILTSNVPKKEIQFLFRLGLNSMKRLWCNADTEMISVFSSITLNLRTKSFVFQYMHMCCVGTKYSVHYCNYYSSTQAPYSHQITGSSALCRLHSFFSWLLWVKKKRIDKSKKFLDLGGNMLMSVLLRLL